MNTAWLLEAAIRTLIMGSITFLVLRVLRIEQVRARRTAWLLALAGALLMPLLVAAHIGPRILPELKRTEAAVFSAESGLAGTLVYQARVTTEAALPSVIAVDDADAQRSHTMSAASVALNLYIVIATLLLLRLSLGLAMALRLKWRAQPVDSRRINMPAAANADVRVSAQLANPVTITSSILLPRNYLHWDAATLRIVLSHEFAHVRQKDFYVQLLAGLHCALFWFNPFSWWLQRQLADLGEALSDHAASQQADSRASYAEILLGFATGAQPPFSAVAMARSSNLAPRIERLLSDRGFERSFSGKPRLPLVAAGVVIMALLASTAVKRVDAAESAIVTPPTPEMPQSPETAPAPEAPPPADAPPAPTKPAPARPPARPIPPLIARVAVVPAVPPVPGVAPVPAVASVPAAAPTPAVPPAPAMPPWRVAAMAASPGFHGPSDDHALSTWIDIDDAGLSYMSVDDDEVFVFKSGDARLMFNGDFKKRFGRDMPTAEGDFIFYQHNGKPYLVQDPAILAKALELYAPLRDINAMDKNAQRADLARAQANLVSQRRVLKQKSNEMKLSTAEFQAAVEEISKMLAQMKDEKLTVQADQKILYALQNRLGSIQGRLGELQGQVAMQTAGVQMQAELATQQAELAADHAQREAEHETAGGTNVKIINDAQRELKPLIEQAIKDGRVKPVN
jgi:beta-lactamase regulating signal transducer with metallopeptidase domain